jgi:hypothetical protein
MDKATVILGSLLLFGPLPVFGMATDGAEF